MLFVFSQVMQHVYMAHIQCIHCKHWVHTPDELYSVLCTAVVIVLQLSHNTDVVLTWSNLEQGHRVLETVRLYAERSLQLSEKQPKGRRWDTKVRHLRAICQHSHQHTLPFTPTHCKQFSLTNHQSPFLKFLPDFQGFFSDMNSATKVGEIFLAAGTAYSKLGEVDHSYQVIVKQCSWVKENATIKQMQ